MIIFLSSNITLRLPTNNSLYLFAWCFHHSLYDFTSILNTCELVYDNVDLIWFSSYSGNIKLKKAAKIEQKKAKKEARRADR